MGWRGTIRSIAAAQRRAERDAVRRQRELERQHKQHAKMLEREGARYEADVYQNHIDVLRSVHKDCGASVDWTSVGNAREPVPPIPDTHHERIAAQALANYRPGLLDRLLGRVEARRTTLAAEVEAARMSDSVAHEAALRKHAGDRADWEEQRGLAERVLAGDAATYMEVLRELDPFSEIEALGSSVEFEAASGGPIEARVYVHAEDVIPGEIKSVTQSGKLSVKKMPQGQFNELYQDYVCGSALRVAREILAILPVQSVIVTMIGDLLDTATGHLEPCPVVSAAIPRATLERLNFDAIDPSDALRNFVHRMDFKKTRGFAAVERLRPTDLQGAS